MIRRSFNPRFRAAILAETKCTTIRDKPWPLGVPIMAFEWSGLPYRSKQADIAPVTVAFTTPITITRLPAGGICYAYSTCGDERLATLWQCEGFHSQADMNAWFQALLKPGQATEKHLMRFSLYS